MNERRLSKDWVSLCWQQATYVWTRVSSWYTPNWCQTSDASKHQHWQTPLLLTLFPKSPQTLLWNWGQVLSSSLAMHSSLLMTGHLWELGFCWTMDHLLCLYLNALFRVSASLKFIRTSVCLALLVHHPGLHFSPLLAFRSLRHTTMGGRLILLSLCYQRWVVICQYILYNLSWHRSTFSDVPLADPAFGWSEKIDLLLGIDMFVDVLLHGW